jgi:hypothetical protein
MRSSSLSRNTRMVGRMFDSYSRDDDLGEVKSPATKGGSAFRALPLPGSAATFVLWQTLSRFVVGMVSASVIKKIMDVIATTSKSRAPRLLLFRRWTDSLPARALRQLVSRAAGLRFIGLWLFGFLVALHLTLRHCCLPCWLLALNHWAASESNRGHRV